MKHPFAGASALVFCLVFQVQAEVSQLPLCLASVSAPAVEAGSHGYVANFDSADWSGDLTRYRLQPNGQREALWSARARLDAQGMARRVLMNRDGVLIDFSWDMLDAAQQAALDHPPGGEPDGLGRERLAFLRGERGEEGRLFRQRSSVLGDIVNSTPLLIGPPSRNARALDRLEGNLQAQHYSAFKAAQGQRPSVLYVGANDGMLHAFAADSGDELFAFVPSAVIGELNQLADPGYVGDRHRYFVDGPLVAEDVYIDGDWHTVLVGSLGGGGRGFFALDVSDPRSPRLLWEIDASERFAELGFGLPRPSLVRLSDGRWVVLAANGYGSRNDRALLYLIDIGSGRLLQALAANDHSGVPNGLSSPRAVDIDGDGIADYAYAGDLLGNLWRFDLAAGTEGARTAFAGRPLFAARDAAERPQPISAAPRVIRHPTGEGLLVLFGTGKFFEEADARPAVGGPMSLYGIWDRQTAGEAALGTPHITRTDLQRQVLGAEDAAGRRSLSRHPVVWRVEKDPEARVKQWGWYLDLPEAGERSIADPVSSGQLALFTTLAPNADPCSGVVSRLLAVDPRTGGAPQVDALDANRDGSIDEADRREGEVVASLRLVVGDSGLSYAFDLANGLGIAQGRSETVRFFDGVRPGRQSWRVLEGGL
ncbi:pilus assembly protein [Pseudomonas knackmussii]|uniref:pilus assembly protein n=1 Tax=Pseudomonas knackmussii TaxID=65741 RepID=UPI003BC5343B